MTATLGRRLAAESVGSTFLLAVVIGSGIMGEHLAAGNVAIALLANSLATGCGLAVLIVTMGPISGAHFNPAVSVVAALEGWLDWRHVAPYIVAQVVGAFVGVATAHLMFAEPLFSISQKVRTGPPQWFAEAVATFGLVMTIVACVRRKSSTTTVAAMVAMYITAAYWFTSSTSFANPAVTLARAASNTFAGIRPDDLLGFIVAQLAAALAAAYFMRWLIGSREIQL
jgi:glycerol uptake facilitator-like aquaporin